MSERFTITDNDPQRPGHLLTCAFSEISGPCTEASRADLIGFRMGARLADHFAGMQPGQVLALEGGAVLSRFQVAQ